MKLNDGFALADGLEPRVRGDPLSRVMIFPTLGSRRFPAPITGDWIHAAGGYPSTTPSEKTRLRQSSEVVLPE